MKNVNLKIFGLVSLLVLLAIAFVSLACSFLMNQPRLEDIILTYNGSNNLVYVEYKPGFTALFLNPKKFTLSIVPIGKVRTLVKLNFTLELYGDAVLGKWPKHIVENLDELGPSISQLNVTRNFLYTKSILIDYDIKTRNAYLNGSNIGILPFGINFNESVNIMSVWLQDINSEKLNLSFPPSLFVKAVLVGNSTLDFSNNTSKIVIKVPITTNETMLSRLPGLKIIKKFPNYLVVSRTEKIEEDHLPPAYKELAEILGTRRLEFAIYSNSSAAYSDFLLSSIQFEKTTGIPFIFSLSGGPKLLVKGGNYTFNGKPIRYFPVSPLAYFLGLRNFDYISFYLTNVKRK